MPTWMGRVWRGSLLALLLTCGCTGYLTAEEGACVLPEDVLPGDERVPKIVGGEVAEDDPAVVGILPEAGDIFCSGTLVAEQVVLTAAHCVQDRVATDLRVHFGVTADDGVRVRVIASAIHPDFVPAPAYDNDLAMLLLEAPVGSDVATPARLATCVAAPLVGADVKLVGFGRADTADLGPPFKREGSAEVRWVQGATFTSGALPSQACHGDSGGPAYLRFAEHDYLVGVVSHGDRGCERFTTFTRVDAFYESFIVHYLSVPGGEPSGELDGIAD